MASADTDLGRRGQAGTAANLAQTGHSDHFVARHLESGRRYCGIRLTRHRMSVMVESVLMLMPFSSFHPFSAPMAFILQPWQLFVTILAAVINHYAPIADNVVAGSDSARLLPSRRPRMSLSNAFKSRWRKGLIAVLVF